MNHQNFNAWLLTVSFSSVALAQTLQAAPERLEDYYPAEVQVEVKHKALDAQTREYLKQFGVDDRTLDLFGGIYIEDYVDSVAEGVRWGDIRPDDLGNPQVHYDATGMVQFPPEPASGVHPRMFFTDAERAQHRDRLENTHGGREGWKVMMGYSQLLKGLYDGEADYAQPDTFKGSFGVHGFLPLFRAGSNNETNRVIWDAYTDGTLPEGLPANQSRLNPGLCAIEAYRCWVYDDAEGARKVANAMETAIRHELAQLEPGKLPGEGFGILKGSFGYNLTYVYDFIYNYMTPEQRRLFHGSILAANLKSNQYGVFQNTGNTASNWATFSYRMHGWLGLEGDPGFNRLQYLGYKRGMENYFEVGFFAGGTCFEAFGKNQIGGEIVYPMARRGDLLGAHPHILATLREYLPHAILPWGNEYVAYDRWGGLKPLNQNDILPMKALFPEDPRIDWVYRNTVKQDYSWKEGDLLRVEGYHNNALFAVLWATDYIEGNDDPGQLMDSESFVDGQRGLAITRSDWTKDALYLHHHVRGQSGGHVFADRSSFLLGGRGRIWVPNPAIGYETAQNSVVMIDGLQLANRAPSQMADYQRTDVATFSTADLRDTVNYDYRRLHALTGSQEQVSIEDALAGNYPEMPEGWEPEMKSFNDYALTKDTQNEVYSIPRFARPDWYAIGKAEGAIRRKRDDIEVSKAFRTIGMVRPSSELGEPYVLAIDDWATSDGEAHQYDWQMRLAGDLMVLSQTSYTLGKDGKPTRQIVPNQPVFHDVLLAPSDVVVLDKAGRPSIEAVGSPALLVRVLQMDGEAPDTDSVMIGFADDTVRKLMIRTHAKEPNFKVLLYPHLHRRSQMPQTTWDETRQNLTVSIGKQVDQIAFSTGESGRTTFKLTRSEAEAVESAEFEYAGEAR